MVYGKQTPYLGITCLIQETLCHFKTPYQDLAVLDTRQFGRMLVLDGMVMTTERMSLFTMKCWLM